MYSPEAAPLPDIPLIFDPTNDFRCISVVPNPVNPAVGKRSLISQILQLQAQVFLAILDIYHKLGG